MSKKIIVILSLFGLLIVIGFSALGFAYYATLGELREAKDTFNTKEAGFLNEVQKLEEENLQLTDALQSERERNNALNREVDSISQEVGLLQKLSLTDKELLQKYSRVYFLSENYVPEKLVSVDEKYLYEKSRKSLMHAGVQKFLYRLMNDAESDNVPVLIVSAYRSFGEQVALKTGYLTTYGSGSNKFSADQGYSEHQLGTAMDFTTPSIKASFEKIDTTPAFEWLVKNAHKYGFTLSYPKGNAYYQPEPWHWRFVGVDLAGILHDRGQYFYNLPQREIDTYLVSIFD